MPPEYYPMHYQNSPVYAGAKQIAAALRQAGGQVYFVGGAVRDCYLHQSPKDIDLVTTLTPEQVQKVFPQADLVGANFGVLIVKNNGINYEVATAREERNYMDGRHPEEVKYTDDIAVDVRRRDFTVNGLLYDCQKEVLIDYVGGVPDLEQGILRTIGEASQRFKEDYLRMLRGIRFASRYQFKIADATWQSIRQLSGKCAEIAGERLHAELTMMFIGKHPDLALEYLDKSGILAAVLPEVAALHQVGQSPKFHPEGDVWEHTMLMFKHLVSPNEELAWSVLLHDIGKPASRTYNEQGEVHFYNHETLGVPIAEKILQRLRFANMAQEHILTAIRNHMRFASVKAMRPGKLRQLLGEETFALELELNRLDCIACHGFLDCWTFLLDQVIAQKGLVKLPDKFVGGKDLLRLGLTPSPQFKTILDDFYERQLAGEFTDRASALAALRQSLHRSGAITGGGEVEKVQNL